MAEVVMIDARFAVYEQRRMRNCKRSHVTEMIYMYIGGYASGYMRV
jgi:hypothetical protein